MEEALSKLPEDGVLLLDFEGIVAISPSCADEFLGKLYSSITAGEHGDRAIFLRRFTSDHQEVLEPILKRREVVAAKLSGGGIRLVGAPAHLEDTLLTARRLKRFRASELASRLGLTISAMDNRLAKLWRSHLVRRESVAAPHGGREYSYTAVV